VPGKHEEEKVVLSRTAAALASTLLCLLMLSPPAQATFPGVNGKIAFERCPWNSRTGTCNGVLDLYTMNADGSNLVNLTNGAFPSNGI
jgi:hypothetical protein